MPNQGEYVPGSWDPFVSSDPPPAATFLSPPMENGFSYNNMHNVRAQPFLPPTMLNSMSQRVGAPPMVLPRTNSGSSLNNMSLGVAPPPMAFPRTNSCSSLNNMSLAQTPPPNPLSRTGSASSLHDMPYLPTTNPTSSLHGNHGVAFLPRRSSASSLHSMASEQSQMGLQKISFVIPNPPGPPTLVHMYTTASPTSPAPPQTMFNTGNFAMSPQSMSPAAGTIGGGRKSWLLDEVSRKVLHQVEFYFSDLNVATTDHLIKYMTKNPEGYVPISVIASFKKIRTATSSNAQIADILRHSERLIVSDDGQKVKRVDRLCESYLEALQCRIVVAENLPEDHCHQSLMRIFSEVGSVKAIRACLPSASSGVVSSTPKAETSDGLFHSNKLHAFIEYESVEMAEKAVAELNDVDNWRNGLKVHFLVKPQAKSSPPKSVKVCHFNDTCGSSADESEGSEDGEQKKYRGRGWGKGGEQPQYHPLISRGKLLGSSRSSPNLSILSNHEHHGPIKQPHVPRMPDGTRGFSMGRGKMIAAGDVRV